MKQECFYDYWTIRVKRIEKLKKAVSPLLFCACPIQGEIWVSWGLAFGRIVDEVKLEMIGTVMNFLCILQGQLSFMVAYGVTCNSCYVECKGRKGFLNWYGNCTLLTPKISPVSVILLNVCYFGFFAVIGRISVNGSDGVILVLVFAESVRKYLCISLCNCTQKIWP